MKKLVVVLLMAANFSPGSAQVVNTATMDTSDFAFKGKVTFEAYLDTYYAYNFNKPTKGDQPYLVSMGRHNEVNINLAFVDVKYSSSRLRGRIVPGFGTYVNSNYASESGTVKNLIEASAGVKLFKHQEVWLDVGVLGSPYTNESAVSKDHLTYTRSLAAENVPYYLSGVKLSLPLHRKINAYLYLLNGWQQIQDQNKNKSLGTQLEYRPNRSWLINWNTYIGNENSIPDSTSRARLFTDVYFIYSHNRFSATGCAYVGLQDQGKSFGKWWQANLTARYRLKNIFSLTGRLEYFQDGMKALVMPVTDASRFETYGASLGVDVSIDKNILFRVEGRSFFSDKEVFIKDGSGARTSLSVTSGLTIWF